MGFDRYDQKELNGFDSQTGFNGCIGFNWFNGFYGCNGSMALIVLITLIYVTLNS